MLSLRRTILLELDTLGLLLFVFGARIINPTAFGALKMNDFTHIYWLFPLKT